MMLLICLLAYPNVRTEPQSEIGRNRGKKRRKLVQLFSPKTKSRSISLLAALMNIPAFSLKDKTLMDQILGLERLRTEYMRSLELMWLMA